MKNNWTFFSVTGYMIGIIYIIKHKHSEICYIGSTFKTLKERWIKHYQNYKNPHFSISVFEYFHKYGIQNFKIQELKYFEVVDRKHMQAYEQLYINKFKNLLLEYICINERNPFPILEKKQRQKEYYQKYKKDILTQQKAYYQKNAQYIQKRNKEYNQKNSEAIQKQRKEYYQKNIETIREKAKSKFECECGSVFNNSDKSQHKKSKKHQNYINKQDSN
jgi:hypothetical protein